MAPTYHQLCELLGFPVPRSYARFVELTVADAKSDHWEPFEFLPFNQLNNAGPNAISITKPGDSVIFAWTGCDSEHFIFVIDDDASDDRERPIAFWPIDGRDETGLVANSFPEFLEWLTASCDDEMVSVRQRDRFRNLLRDEFGIERYRAPNAIVESARKRRLAQAAIVPTQDHIGVALPIELVDRRYLDQIPWPQYDYVQAKPIPGLLDEAERRLAKGELGTALILARNYRFHWWYEDWKTDWQIIQRTCEILSTVYRQLGRPMAAAEIERQTEWNLFNVS